jgi:hypothetical protein
MIKSLFVTVKTRSANVLLFVFLTLSCMVICTDVATAQKMKKVRVKQKLVAYDQNGKVIDSLTRSLKNQSQASKFLDQLQVDMRQIELTLKTLREDPNDTAAIHRTEKEKEKLLNESMNLIRQIQDDKSALVKEYYIVIESFKSKKNAFAAVKAWQTKGAPNAFVFCNKHRKWYYVCATMQRSYKKAILSQFSLQQKGIDSWIYYWME